MTEETYKQIDEATKKRYSVRLRSHGVSHLTLGWGSREQQNYRFDRVIENVVLSGKSVLDVGCGFGDLVGYLKDKDIHVKSYTGIDVNPELIEEAKKLHPDARFIAGSLREVDREDIRSDVVIMLGLLNFCQNEIQNTTYAKDLVSKAFDLAVEKLAVDFLSSCRFEGYPEEDFVYYYDPGFVLELGLSLSPSIRLIQDYEPIPQREIMLVVSR
jgi:SAM-dependent methyltransferase